MTINTVKALKFKFLKVHLKIMNQLHKKILNKKSKMVKVQLKMKTF